METPKRPAALYVAVGCGALVLLAVAGLTCAGLGAIALPNFLRYQLVAKRAELPTNVNAIAIAESAVYAAEGHYMPCGSRAAASARVGTEPRAWDGRQDGDCWDTLGFAPAEQLRGSYWVESGPDTIEVHGVSDLDGDGVLAEYVASGSGRAEPVTPDDAF
jgi:hypothetical protein